MTGPTDHLTNLFEELQRTPNFERHIQLIQTEMTNLVSKIDGLFDKTHHGCDDSGAVEVEIDGRGDIKALKVTARGMKEHDHETLGPAVVGALNNAYLALAEYMKEEFTDKTGQPIPNRVDIDWESALNFDLKNLKK